MSSDHQEIFTKQNLDGYQKELSKEYRTSNRKHKGKNTKQTKE